MFSLVLKDILIQKKYVLFSLLYTCFFTFIFKSNLNPSMVFGMIPVMVAYMLIIGACGYDDKNKCEIMLNSLPINRINLVISKYLSAFVFIFMGLFLTFTITTILNLSGFIHFNRLMNLEDILGPIIGILILSSLYFPCYFKLGYQKSRYFLIAAFFAIFAVSSFLGEVVVKGSNRPSFIICLNSQPNWLITTFIIIIAFMILLISMLLSVRFYINKDL